LSLGEAEFWAVIGRNGAGKTTWMRTVLGLLPPVKGKVEYPQGPLRLAYLPQRTGLDELYPLLARDVVRMGLDRDWSFARPLAGAAERVEEALRDMEVSDLADQPFRHLSEGQKQRVMFARLAAASARVALLDEPTSAMDAVAECEAFKLLDRMRRKRRTTVVVVSHFLGVAREYASRVILMDRDTPAVVVGTADEVFEHQVFKQRFGEPCIHQHHGE
jgi:zinc transport system ATP-binding protein